MKIKIIAVLSFFYFFTMTLALAQKNSDNKFIIKKINHYLQKNIFPVLEKERKELVKKFSVEDYKKWEKLTAQRKIYQQEKNKWLGLSPQKNSNIMEIWEDLQKKDKLQWLEANELANKYEKIWQKNIFNIKNKVNQWEIDVQNIIFDEENNDAENDRKFKKHQWGKLFLLTDVLLASFENLSISNENAADMGEND